jgi:ubiquinone/menaquinone biosynthesis C-methylase UbiE
MSKINAMELNAWRAFDPKFADNYLRSDGSREQSARNKVVSLISDTYVDIPIDENGIRRALRLLEFGSGNGERLDLVLDTGIKVDWTGIDISSALVESATFRHPNQTWIVGDAEYPELVLRDAAIRPYDICLFCHVLEMLESPELALRKAKLLGKVTIIEFFEPPNGKAHKTEIKYLQETNLPYLRHTIGRETYLAWVASAGFKNLIIHQTFGKYEVHVLY